MRLLAFWAWYRKWVGKEIQKHPPMLYILKDSSALWPRREAQLSEILFKPSSLKPLLELEMADIEHKTFPDAKHVLYQVSLQANLIRPVLQNRHCF